jgi:hypothetical protein
MFGRHFVTFMYKYAEYKQTCIAFIDNKQNYCDFLFVTFPYLSAKMKSVCQIFIL